MRKNALIMMIVILTSTVNGQNDTSSVQLLDTFLLKETSVEAFKADKSTPITFKNISKEEIDLTNIGQEPSKMLSFTPSINAYSDAGNYQGYSYFRLRGIDQTRVNMTMDGIPLNDTEDQGVYFSNYPDFFNSIETIQIQRGVGTSTNGVASYAGSINYQSPNLMSEKYTEMGANYGSFNSYRIYGEFNRGLVKDKGFYIRVSNLSSDGYKFHSKNESTSAFLSFGIFKAKHKLKFTGFLGNQKNQLAWIGVPMDSLKNEPRTNGNSDERDEFLQSLMSIQHTYTLSEKANINTTVYYNFLQGNYDFDLNNFLEIPLTNEMYNYDFKHDFIGGFSSLNWQSNKLKINTGIHLNSFKRRHVGSERSLGELYENTGFKNEFSSFIKMEYTFNKLVFFGDVQYRYAEFDYVGSVNFEKMSWQFLNPKVGLNYFISANTNVYYSLGANTREPTRNDILNGEDDLLSDSLGNAIFTDVNPEQVLNHEIGIKSISEKWTVALNYYMMNFSDEIVLNGQFGPNGLALHSNVAKSYRNGIELDLKVKLIKDLYYTNNSSWSFNQITEGNISIEPILSPTLMINQMISYQGEKIESGIMLKYQEKSFIDFENQHSIPSFYSVDCFASYKVKSFKFRVGINNITNQRIISNGYIGIYGSPLYFVQAPLNYNLGILWKF